VPAPHLGIVLALACAGVVCGSGSAGFDAGTGSPGTGLDLASPAPARGWITLGFQALRSEGSLDGGGDDLPFLRDLSTDTRSLMLGIDYRLNQRWSLQASLPYIRKRSRNDPGAHDPTALARPRPASEFIDDGSYHGTFQDWQLGATYHTTLAGLDLRPHVVLTYPAQDYVFFASAAAGQRLARLRLGFDASRRWGSSNAHYAAGYSYELVERVLGYNLDKHHFRASGRYDFSPALSASVFVNARRGHGAQPSDFFADRPQGNERWFQHDRLLRQNFGLAGLGATWRLDERWALSASRSWMVWGDSIHDTDYAYEVLVQRAF
jgi:hypothetical protein